MNDYSHIELKPCPFCGNEAEIRCCFGRDTICCKGCNATMISDYTPIEVLIVMWNRRAPIVNISGKD